MHREGGKKPTAFLNEGVFIYLDSSNFVCSALALYQQWC